MSDKGAHFYRCDLQVHTPRDFNWTGGAHVTDDERQNYAARLVQACRDRGLQGISITDHHDMVFVSYVRRAAGEETDPDGQFLPKEQQLVVFPGMELTLAVPCQALLIFDAEFPDDLFDLAIKALAITPIRQVTQRQLKSSGLISSRSRNLRKTWTNTLTCGIGTSCFRTLAKVVSSRCFVRDRP